MINQIIATCFISIFWASFLLVGRTIDGRFALSDNAGVNFDFWQKLTLYFLIGWATMAAFSVIFMLVKIPVIVLSILWVLLVGLCGFDAIRNWQSLRTWLFENDWLVKLLFLAVLITCLFLGGKWQAPAAPSSDSWVHIGRILNNLRNGLNIYDPYFSQLADPRYHFNAYHPIMAVGSQLTGMSAVEFWKHMQGFSMFIGASSLYFITSAMFEKDKILKFFIFLTLISLVLFFHPSKNFFHAIYPRSFGVAWLNVFVVLLAGAIAKRAPIKQKVDLDKGMATKSLILLCIVAFAIATTHHIVAAITLALSGMALFTYWVFKPTPARLMAIIKTGLMLSPAFILLFLAPLITVSLPSHMTEATINYGLKNMPFTEVWGQEIVTLRRSIGTWPIILSYLIGIIYLLRKNQALAAVILGGLMVFPFLVSNPIVFPVIREHIPVWALARFKMAGVMPYQGLSFIGWIILIKMVFDVLVEKVPVIRTKFDETPNLRIFATLALIAVFMIPTYPQLTRGIDKKAKVTADYFKRADWGYLMNDQTLKFPIDDNVPNQFIVTDQKTAYTLPANFNVDVMTIVSTHATQSAIFDDRKACLKDLMGGKKNARHQAQALIKPTYYIFTAKQKKFGKFPELKLIASHNIFKQTYNIYEVQYGGKFADATTDATAFQDTPCGRIATGKS